MPDANSADKVGKPRMGDELADAKRDPLASCFSREPDTAQFGRCGHDAFGKLDALAALRGQRDPSARTVDKARAKLTLEFLETQRDRWLCRTELRCRAPEAAKPGDPNKSLDAPEVHDTNSISKLGCNDNLTEFIADVTLNIGDHLRSCGAREVT